MDRQAYARVFRMREHPDAWGWGNKRHLQEGWRELEQRCTDRASRIRLAHLLTRLGSSDRGAKESALAELELAALLLRAGCSVTFLPESQARTADLECTLEQTRFFVEVTALVGSGHSRFDGRSPRRGMGTREGDGEEEGEILIRRLLARVSQKARQLSDYAEPVVLSITVPHRDDRDDVVDLKQLAGALTVLLPLYRHLSAVLLALWDVHPAPSRSGVRLSNVYLVERSGQQRTHPRVRLLVMNPAAAKPLRGEEFQVIRALL